MALFTDTAPRTPSPILRLEPGQCYVPNQGWYLYHGGRYSSLQRFDPVAQVWRYAGDDTEAARFTYFDGQTLRIANPTGCAVGAVVTTAGSGYLPSAPPSITASAGGSTWQAIIGGALSTAAVIAVAGSGYTYPPLLWIAQPPEPGVQATGYTTITNGSISAVTIDGQGAGYTTAPTVAIINDERDTTGSGGQVTVSVIGSGTVTAVVCTNHGNPITSGTIPTLTFGSGAAAATVVMDWSISSVSITTAGAGYTSTSACVLATGAGGYTTATPVLLGNDTSIGMSRWRSASVMVNTNTSGGLASVPAIIDGGRYSAIPYPAITAAAPPSTTGVLAFTMGGVNTSVFLMPAQQ